MLRFEDSVAGRRKMIAFLRRNLLRPGLMHPESTTKEASNNPSSCRASIRQRARHKDMGEALTRLPQATSTGWGVL